MLIISKKIGCVVFVCKPKEHKLKLDNQNTQSIFVGYDGKLHKVWMSAKRRLCINRNVLVIESPLFQTMTPLKNVTKTTHGNENQQSNNDPQDSKVSVEDFHFKVTIEDHGNEESLKPTMQVHHKPTREKKLLKRLEDFVILTEFANIMNSLEDLVTLIKALARDDVQN